MRDLPEESHDEVRLRDDLNDLLARVARPGRYVGGEFHIRRKPGASPRIVLSYPDVYEIGIANTGLQVLYAGLNDATPAAAERAYCPWPDMALLMRARGVPLWSLESGAPVRDAALWGFTLQHELTYTNILEMLDLAGVPLHAGERDEADPIVLGGGPGTANPLPLAPFFDAFFVGEAEGRLAEIVDALQAPTRAGRLRRLGAVPGVYLPHDSQAGERRSPRPPPGLHGLLADLAGHGAAGAAHRGRPRPRGDRGHARLQRRLSFLSGRGCGTGPCVSVRPPWWSTPPHARSRPPVATRSR